MLVANPNCQQRSIFRIERTGMRIKNVSFIRRGNEAELLATSRVLKPAVSRVSKSTYTLIQAKRLGGSWRFNY